MWTVVDQEPRLKITKSQDRQRMRNWSGEAIVLVWNSVLIDASRALAHDGSGPTTEALVVDPRVADTQPFCFLIRHR
jgi:hypothetical protein